MGTTTRHAAPGYERSNVSAKVLDGRRPAAAIRTDRVATPAARGSNPGLGTVAVGDDPGSRAYVAGKHRGCEQAPIAFIRREPAADATQQQVETVIDGLTADPARTGYTVQLPRGVGADTEHPLYPHLSGDVR
ncbi:tetrahydrofolate dehydrogenase/cyclohydrolase catalytic domain-containing protein [Streptomyces sp. NPDC002889]|uniref:tetrahydrofolate dehydrogenase/cyclohydrolase catalytic domain-containing protein n=1 Tax=Streptomyces sp. NPDC002889 TaxID=3364669 RepID=UPI0036AE8978